LASAHEGVHLWHLHEHQIAERRLCVIGDAHLDESVRQPADPLVTSRVLQIAGNIAHSRISYDSIWTRILPLRTNGGFTTRAACGLPRMSTSTRGPVPAGTRASAIARFMVGEKVPLVTSPTGFGAPSAKMR